MFNNDRGRSIIVLLIFVLVLCTVIGISRMTAVSAQEDGSGMPGMGGPGMPGMMPGMMPGQGMMPGMMPGMMGQMGGPSSIAVADGFVYVVHGGKLSQFNAKTLKLVNSVDLMPRMNPNGMGGMNGHQGGQGGGMGMPGGMQH